MWLCTPFKQQIFRWEHLSYMEFSTTWLHEDCGLLTAAFLQLSLFPPFPLLTSPTMFFFHLFSSPASSVTSFSSPFIEQLLSGQWFTLACSQPVLALTFIHYSTFRFLCLAHFSAGDKNRQLFLKSTRTHLDDHSVTPRKTIIQKSQLLPS